MDSISVVVVDDFPDILELLDYNLQSRGYNTTTFTNPADALSYISSSNTDLVITDWMMPQISGLELVQSLRSNSSTSHIPIIMLSCLEEESQIVEAFDYGVEDYLVKPFKINELSAKISRITKARTKNTAPCLHLDHDSFEAYLDQKELQLTFSEFRFLETILTRPNKVFSRERLIEILNGSDYLVTARTIDVLVVGIRKKLGSHKNIIQTVRSVGYKYVPEV